MSLFLKKFDNHTEYEEARQNLILPNVSYCVNENEVHYNPFVDPYNGHEYVDLGLPSGTKWATMNVGATSITDYGNYYQYGKGANDVSITSGQSDYSGTENPLAVSADTAVQVWGGSWHMPTSVQFQELLDNTTYELVTDYQSSGISGFTFTANGKTLFIPAAGYYVVEEQRVFSGLQYHSSTPYGSTSSDGLKVEIDITVDFIYRVDGCPIRPVVG